MYLSLTLSQWWLDRNKSLLRNEFLHCMFNENSLTWKHNKISITKSNNPGKPMPLEIQFWLNCKTKNSPLWFQCLSDSGDTTEHDNVSAPISFPHHFSNFWVSWNWHQDCEQTAQAVHYTAGRGLCLSLHLQGGQVFCDLCDNDDILRALTLFSGMRSAPTLGHQHPGVQPSPTPRAKSSPTSGSWSS